MYGISKIFFVCGNFNGLFWIIDIIVEIQGAAAPASALIFLLAFKLF